MEVRLLDRDQPGKQASWASAGIVTTKIPRGWAPATLLNNLSVALWPRLAEELRGEIAPLRQAGVAAELVEGAALREAEPALGPAVVAAQLLPGGNVENRRAVRALELALRRSGGEVVAGAQVTAVLSSGG